MTAPTPTAFNGTIDVATFQSFQSQSYDIGIKMQALENLIPSAGPLKTAAAALHDALAVTGSAVEVLFGQPANTFVPPPPPSGGAGKGRP